MSLNNSIEAFRDMIKFKKEPLVSKQAIINVIRTLEIISKIG
jgi:hypothetical protein